jgi:hypothetical protein
MFIKIGVDIVGERFKIFIGLINLIIMYNKGIFIIPIATEQGIKYKSLFSIYYDRNYESKRIEFCFLWFIDNYLIQKIISKILEAIKWKR